MTDASDVRFGRPPDIRLPHGGVPPSASPALAVRRTARPSSGTAVDTARLHPLLVRRLRPALRQWSERNLRSLFSSSHDPCGENLNRGQSFTNLPDFPVVKKIASLLLYHLVATDADLGGNAQLFVC